MVWFEDHIFISHRSRDLSKLNKKKVSVFGLSVKLKTPNVIL